MPNIRADITSDFKTIYLVSDSSSMNSDYPVLEIYVDTKLTYTLAVNGTQTIDSVVYNTTSGATDLSFTSTVTTNGTEYIFTITPTVLGIDQDQLPDGVYTLKLLDSTTVSDISTSVVSYPQLSCCMSKKLDDAYSKSLSDIISKAEQEVITIKSLIISAEESAAIGSVVNATKKLAIATKLCSTCGCIQ